MTTMLIDHIAFWFVDNNIAMRNIGRLAFFIYAFLIAESYYHLQYKPKKLLHHLIKLIALCLITEPLFDFFDHIAWNDPSSQSVMPTLTFGFAALIGIGYWSKTFGEGRRLTAVGSCIICLIAALASFFLKSDYAFSGVLLIVLFYYYLTKTDKMVLPQKVGALLAIEAVFIITDIWRRTDFGNWQAFKSMADLLSMWKYGMAIVIIPLVFYNRKLVYHSRWFSWLYSIFYPLQFAVLLILRYYIKGF